MTCGKSFQSEISSTFSFYARDLNLVSKCRQVNKLYCEIIKSRGKYWKKNLSILSWNHWYNKKFYSESFCSEISKAFIFYDRELYLVSKCRQMNKLYCEIIKTKIRGKKTRNSTSWNHQYTEKFTPSLAFVAIAQLLYGKVYEVEAFSVEKLRKFIFETYINVNGKDIK